MFSKESVHRIVLAGGSSRRHVVADLLCKAFRQDCIMQDDVDTIVTIDAAITALQRVQAYLPPSMKAKYGDVFKKRSVPLLPYL